MSIKVASWMLAVHARVSCADAKAVGRHVGRNSASRLWSHRMEVPVGRAAVRAQQYMRIPALFRRSSLLWRAGSMGCRPGRAAARAHQSEATCRALSCKIGVYTVTREKRSLGSNLHACHRLNVLLTWGCTAPPDMTSWRQQQAPAAAGQVPPPRGSSSPVKDALPLQGEEKSAVWPGEVPREKVPPILYPLQHRQ